MHLLCVGTSGARLASTVGFVRDAGTKVIINLGMVADSEDILAPLAELGELAASVTDVVFPRPAPSHTRHPALFPNARYHDHQAIYHRDRRLARRGNGFLISPAIRLIETPGPAGTQLTTLAATAHGVVVFTHLRSSAAEPLDSRHRPPGHRCRPPAGAYSPSQPASCPAMAPASGPLPTPQSRQPSMPATTHISARPAAPSAARTRHSANEMLAVLYADHGSDLLRFAERLTGDPAIAEDIVQETMLRAWRHPDRVGDRSGEPRAWLYTVVRHLAIDRHRARQARPAEAAGLTVLADRAAPDQIGAAITQWDLASALADLRPRDRELLVARYLGDRSIHDMAADLNVPAGTIKSRLSAARSALRRNLQARNGSAGRREPTTLRVSRTAPVRALVAEC